MKTLLTLPFFGFALIGFGQEQYTSCRGVGIYEVFFSELLEVRKDTFAIEFKNSPSTFLIKEIQMVSHFSEEQMKSIASTFTQKWDYSSCLEFVRLLEHTRENVPLAKDSGYSVMYCSQPVFIDESRAIITLSFASRKKGSIGGKAIGYDVLMTYQLQDGQWHRIDRKLLSAY